MIFNDHKLRAMPVGRNHQSNTADELTIASFSTWGKFILGITFLVMSVLLFYQYSSIHGDNETVKAIDIDNFTPTSDFLRSTNDQCNALFRVQLEIDGLQRQIWNNWNVSHFPYFLKLMEIPQSSWKLQKLKMLKMITESFTNSENVKFVMGFSGSSVTAGHDNYFVEAYPNVVYENLRPIFQSLNVSLVVRNHAIGNNPCYAYDACIATHLGDDLDIVTWEQSMNCGRNVKPLDTFTRQSQFMEKKPTVVYFLSGSPIWTEETCQSENITSDIQDYRPPLAEEEIQLLSLPPANIVDSNHLMENFEFLKDSLDEKNPIPIRFATAAPMAQSIFPIQSYHCFGPYNASFTQKTPGGGAPWHPGKQGHRLRGDNFAYMMLTILSEAIQDFQSLGCANHKNNRMRRFLVQRKNRILRGENVSSGEEIIELLKKYFHLELSSDSVHDIGSPDSSRPFALTLNLFLQKYFTEYYFNHHVNAVPQGYQLPETNYPSQCYTDFEPRVNNPLESIIYSTGADSTINPSMTWKREISFFDKNAIAKAEKKQLGYLDRKYVYMSAGIGSFIQFKIFMRQNNAIWLCELQKGFGKYPTLLKEPMVEFVPETAPDFDLLIAFRELRKFVFRRLRLTVSAGVGGLLLEDSP